MKESNSPATPTIEPLGSGLAGLWVDGVLRVNNDGGHGMVERSGVCALTAGLHDLKVGFSQGTGGFGLEVRWQGPGVAKQLIPDAVLYCLPPDNDNRRIDLRVIPGWLWEALAPAGRSIAPPLDGVQTLLLPAGDEAVLHCIPGTEG